MNPKTRNGWSSGARLGKNTKRFVVIALVCLAGAVVLCTCSSVLGDQSTGESEEWYSNDEETSTDSVDESAYYQTPKAELVPRTTPRQRAKATQDARLQTSQATNPAQQPIQQPTPAQPQQQPQQPQQPQPQQQQQQLQQLQQLQPQQSDECRPQATLNRQKLLNPGRVASHNNLLMARMSGYIELFEPEISFIPLKLERVEMRAEGPEDMNVVLETDCADLSMSYKVVKDQVQDGTQPDQYTSLQSLKWYLRKQPADSKLALECGPMMSFSHRIYSGWRHSCLGRTAHHCYHYVNDTYAQEYAAPVGQIVFETLELELFGNRTTISQGEFSMPPGSSGCFTFY